MLHAPESTPTPTTRPGTAVRPALWWDLLRVAVGRARAGAVYRSPLLVHTAIPSTVLQLLGPIGRAEVWMTGVGTSVTMAPTRATRRPVRADVVAGAVFAVAVVVVPGVAAGVATWNGGIAGLFVLMLVVVAEAILLVPPSVLALRYGRRSGVTVARLGVSGRVVRLHDLARHPADPAGTGTALLTAVVTGPSYSADTVVAIAATGRLADLYAAAGLMRVSVAGVR